MTTTVRDGPAGAAAPPGDRASLVRIDFPRAREIIGDLADPSVGVEAARYLHARIPALAAEESGSTLFGENVASCQANLDEIMRLVASGRPAGDLVVPEAATQFAEALVRRHVPVTVLLRAYRVGHRYVWDRMCACLREGIADEVELRAACEATEGFLFEYIDCVSDDVVAAYDAERDRWMRSSAAVRAEIVAGILDRAPVDERRASARLGYELGRFHVGLLLAGDPAASVGMETVERYAHEASAAIGCRDPLVLPAGGAVAWAWCGTYGHPDDAAIARLEGFRLPAGVRMAVGRPAHGLDGFRVSHTEARHAARFWAADGGSPARSGTTPYRAVELVSLLASDVERARRFVAVELGALAAATDAAGELRRTILAYLGSGGSYVAAANALHVHKNTVYTRVRRAEGLLGRDVSARRVELQSALMLTAALGDEVLATPS